MTSPRKSRSKRALRRAFVVTATAGAIASGCGSTTSNPSDCPESAPPTGEACDLDPEDTCSYDDGCGSTMEFACKTDGWAIESAVSCNPPPPEECPLERPAEGETCTPAFIPESCDFQIETACGAETITLACVADETSGATSWRVTVSPATCPDPPADCAALDTTACGLHTACRWLVPGCGPGDPPASFIPGCYAAVDCVVDACPTGQTCTPVVFDPCWNSLCDACGADAQVCLTM